ncbi:MAG: hypothetical protein Q8R32_00300 [bacterium]|nr:hypothetical protein [bacterium]
MAQLNLAAEVFRSQVMARRKRLVYGLATALLLLALGAWALPAFLTRNLEQSIAQADREIVTLDARLQARREEIRPVVLFLRRLEMLKHHLGEHFGWSPVFAQLERLTPPNARFTALAGSAEGGQLTAQVIVPSVDAAADFIASLQNVRGTNETPFSQVDVKSVNISEGTGAQEYIVSFTLPVSKGLFRLTQKNP